MKTLCRNRSAIALIITLVTLVIATILIVAFVTTMRTERRAASAVANDERSKLIAQTAIQAAMALLSKNIPQPVKLGVSGSAQNWIINPGLLTLYPGADGSTPQYVPLSTNNNSSNPTTLPTTDFVNLNSLLVTSTSSYPIIPTGDAVHASWVYVAQDPTIAASATNPIIGRYAFWMDDENSKININTAYGKPPSLQNMVDGTCTYNYMVRSNPLDHTSASTSTGNPTDNYFGTTTYNAAVGFNSLSGSATSVLGTDGVTYPIYPDMYPGENTSPNVFLSGSNVANAVGNPKTTGSFPGPRFYPIWHPSSINLDILPTSLTNSSPIGATDLPSPGSLNRMSLADWVFNANLTAGVPSNLQNTARWRLFQSPDQIEQFITAGAAAFYQANEFNLTAYNRAPEFNAFGKPRLFMEARINPMQDSTVVAGNFADTSSGNLSGSELEFCQIPDLDPMGPTYFHGYENMAPYTGSTTNYYPDVAGVQMVADYLSTLFARSDWPGMPTVSFVTKWGGGTIGALEADQVAWNIVAMGNYASDMEGMSPNTTAWPDDAFNTFERNSGVSDFDSSGTVGNLYRTKLTGQAIGAPGVDPNLSLRVGKLSGKAIMPYSPKPYVNEIALVVDAVPVTSSTTPNVFNLALSLKVELYVPRRGPPASFWHHLNTIDFVATHFLYIATGTNDKGLQVSCTQGATGSPCYGDGGASDIGSSFAGKNSAGSGPNVYPWANCLQGGFPNPPVSASYSTTYLPIDSYQVCTTSSGKAIYTSTSTAMLYVSGTSVPAGAQKFTGIVNIQAKLRLALFSNLTDNTWEIVPIWDKVDAPPNIAVTPPNGQQDSVSWNFNIDLTPASIPSGVTSEFTRSLEVADARLGGNTNDQNGQPIWKAVTSGSTDAETLDDSTLNKINNASINANLDLDSYGFFDFQGGGAGGGFYKNSPRPSIGFLDCVPTGMQRGLVNSTLTFGPSANKAQLPDWLMLDLVAPTFADVKQPAFAPYSYLHSTMGKININAAIYPVLTGTSGATTRNLPLEALFKNTVPDSALPGLVSAIMNPAQNIKGQAFGALGSQYPQYNYIGELCEIAGVADGTNTPGGTGGTKWQKEALIRNLANLITTQSNTFHLWGAAQAVKVVKGSANTNYGIYQSGDTVTVMGEKRFESVIERSVWPGVDGVPGNGHLGTSGTYDQASTSPIAPHPATLPWSAVTVSGVAAASAVAPNSAQWAQFDGPIPPAPVRVNAGYPPTPGWYGLQYNSTSLQNAQNPAQIIMSYKPEFFRYISE